MRQQPAAAPTQGLSATEGLSVLRILSLGMSHLPENDHGEKAVSAQEAQRSGKQHRIALPLLGPEEVLCQEQHIRGPLRQPPHEVGIPLPPKRNVNPHVVAFLHQSPLQVPPYRSEEHTSEL